jgi:quercetin dioxygenase-like cupin family protein
MVSASMRRLLVGTAAVAASLGWLQLAPAFGFPVTAPAAMLDYVFGPYRDAGAAGWALLLLGEAAFAALFFLVVERQSRTALASLAFALGAWLLSGAVIMPAIGVLQGSPPAAEPANDPMRGNFFMLNLGVGAAAEALIGWLLFGVVLSAGSTLKVRPRALALSLGAAAIAGAIALGVPVVSARADSGRVAEGHVAELPAAPVFISVLELPQPAGAVLGPHTHIAGFVVDVSGTATMVMEGGTVVDVGPGDAVFTAANVPHDHENRAAIPLAIALALILLGLTVALVVSSGRRPAVALAAALLVAGTVATVNPLMNHWYFVAVRPAAGRAVLMPVPAVQRTYESENLTGLPNGPYVELVTHHLLGVGELVRVLGPAAIVVLDGQASIVVDGVDARTAALSAHSGTTIAWGAEAMVRVESGGARVLIVQLVSPG